MSLLLTGSLMTTNSFYVLQNYGQDTEAASGYVEITADIPQSAIDNSEHVFAEVHDSTEYPGRGNGTYDSVDLGEAEDDLTTTIDLRTRYGENVAIHLTIGDEGESNVLTGTLFEVPESAPADALDAQFSVATGTAGNQSLNITIVSEPDVHSDGTQYPEYRVDGGSWTEFTSYSGTGTYEETMAAGETSYGIEIRWTNEIGSGADSGTKSASSSTASGVTPFSDDFNGSIDAGWTFSPNTASTKTAPSITTAASGDDDYARILIPADGGSAGEYDPWDGLSTVPNLLQPCEDGDLDISMGLVWRPAGTGASTGYHGVFLVIAEADLEKMVIAGKTVNNGSDLRTRAYSIEDGVGVTTETNVASSTDHVRMVFDESTGVTTLYHGNDGSTWGSSVDTISYDLVPAYIGICLENGSTGTSGFTADIDYFKISTDDINDIEGGEPA